MKNENMSFLSNFPPHRRLKYNIALMNINALCGALRFFYPVSILYFEQVTGNFTTAMGVFSSAFIAQILCEVPTGAISDRWGRRNLIFIGCLVEFMAVVAYALAGSAPTISGWAWLYLGGALFGFAEACFSGTTNAVIYETLAHYKKTSLLPHIFGRNNAMSQAGLALSGLVAAILLWLGCDFQFLVILTLVPFTINILTAYLLIEPPKHYIHEGNLWKNTKEALHLVTHHKKLRLLAIAEILKDGTGNSAHSFTPQFISSVWPTWAVPLYRMLQNSLGIISFRAAGHIIHKYGPIHTLLASNVGTQVFALIAYVTATVLSPFILLTTQIGYAFSMTANDTLKQENFSDAQRSTMDSLISLGKGLVGAVVGPVIGLLADVFSPSVSLIVILLCGTPTIALYMRLYQHHK